LESTIADVRDAGLCLGCGTCEAVCSTDAIKMVKVNSNGLYLPELDKSKCTLCHLCIQSCPGASVNLRELNTAVFGKQPSDELLGNYLECYVGHSNTHEVRYNSASGGIASHLLMYALEQGIIDGALVVRMKAEKPLEPEPFIARTTQEIISASKSKYCPVPANTALKHIIRNKGRYAVVGLPCHIHGIRKAEARIPTLRNRIVLHVCLLCSHMVNFLGTELILQNHQIPRDKVSSFEYRGHGWPGYMTAVLRDNSRLVIPLIGNWNSYWPVFSTFMFTPMRCTMCPDQSGEFADISLGDAWLPELRGDKIGESIIVTRTEIAEKLVSNMASSKKISLRRIHADKVKQSQALNLTFKKRDLSTRLSMLKLANRSIPDFGNNQSQKHLLSFVRALYIYANINVSSSKHARHWLANIPFPLFRLYFGLYKLLCKA